MPRPTRKSRSKRKANSIRQPDANSEAIDPKQTDTPSEELPPELNEPLQLESSEFPEEVAQDTQSVTPESEFQSGETDSSTGPDFHIESSQSEVIERLEELLQRFDKLDGRLDDFALPGSRPKEQGTPSSLDEREGEERDNPASQNPHDEEASLKAMADAEELSRLRDQLKEAWREIDTLRESTESLNAELADTNAQQSVKSSIGVDESLSWEDRKALIMAQMENDSFDANSFIDSLSDQARSSYESITAEDETSGRDDESLSESVASEQTPVEFVEALVECVNRLEEQVGARDREIADLNNLLQNQSETLHTKSHGGGVAIGAAAIAGLLDGDPLVMEERARLQQLKDDWEDKFRQTEIEASLERAKLSRERQELATRTRELEEKLEEMQREKRAGGDAAVKGRRWLAELGLTPEES